MSRLMTHMGSDAKWMILSWVLSALGSIAGLGPYICIYFVARQLMQIQINPGQEVSPMLLHYGWMGVKAVMVSFSFYGLALFCSHVAAFRLMERLRVQLLRHLERLPAGYHLSQPSGKLRKIIDQNSENTEKFVAHQLPDMVQAVTTPLAFVGCMFWFDWRLCLACLLPTLAGFLILRSILKDYSGALLTRYQTALADMGTGAVEYVRGISVVKVFGQSLGAFTRFHGAIREYKQFVTAYALSMERPMALYFTVINSVFFLLIPAGILIHSLARSGEERGAFILSFIFFMVFTPLIPFLFMRIGQAASVKMICSQALDEIEGVLSSPPMADPDHPVLPENHGICFENVCFAYEKGGPLALDQVSFCAEPGELTAIVGPSGSGKTTIVNLIARFWDPDSGQIRVGGVDLGRVGHRKWMSRVGLVSQDPGLFSMTLGENVAFFAPKAGRKEIEKALLLAQCDDILSKLPRGLDTPMGDGGVHLSYGEMQRVALARTILQDAPILLLDEITAFADPENEYRIQQALSCLSRDKTVIMIAHRLSTIRRAHGIVVLEGGRVVARGCHDQLMAKPGLYRKMYREYQTATTWKLKGETHG